jgi:hypothetical protein
LFAGQPKRARGRVLLAVVFFAAGLHFATVKPFLNARLFVNKVIGGFAAAGTATKRLSHKNRLLEEGATSK